MTLFTQPYQIKRSAGCPVCELGEIELADPYFCDGNPHRVHCELCSASWSAVLTEDQVSLEQNEFSTHEYGFALLHYTGGGLPHYLVREWCLYFDPKERPQHREKAIAHLDYYVSEHTCPTNFLEVEVISLDGDLDPHGVYEFVRFLGNGEIKARLGLTWQGLFNEVHDDNAESFWSELFPELLERVGSNDNSRED